jgi:hypothetical protein
MFRREVGGPYGGGSLLHVRGRFFDNIVKLHGVLCSCHGRAHVFQAPPGPQRAPQRRARSDRTRGHAGRDRLSWLRRKSGIDFYY